MRWLLIVALVGCDRSEPAPRVEVVRYLTVPGERLAEGQALVRRVESVIARGRLAEALGQWQRGAEMAAACEVARCAGLEVEPLFPQDAGYVARAALEGSRGRVSMGEVYVGPGEDGRWRLFEAPPVAAEAGPHTTAARATVELDPHGGAIAVDATLTVRPEGQRYLVFDFLPADGDLVLREVMQDGRPVRFRHLDQRLVVELAATATETALRFCYGGRLPPGVDRVGADEIMLHQAWIPYLGGSADWELDVTYPVAVTLFGALEPVRTERWSGRIRARFTATGLERFPLVGAAHYTTTSFEHRGVRVDLALWPRHAAGLERVAAAVRAALDAYTVLGPFPRDRFRIALGGTDGGTTALAFHSLISLGHAALDGEHLTATVAHELAHVWFGIDVRDPAGRWAEAVASYLTQWAVPERTARDLRWSWAVAYEQLPLHREVALAGTAEPAGDEGIRRALFYGRGALVLTALEDRIGRASMARVLRRLHADAAGERATWAEVIAATRVAAGDEHADWLERWTAAPGAPDLAWREVTRRGSSITAQLVQLGPELYDGQVEVGFTGDAGEVLAVHTVRFAEARTAVSLTAPAEARWLIIDPRHRLPRKPDLDRGPDWGVRLDRL
jgi:hypothetical protein